VTAPRPNPRGDGADGAVPPPRSWQDRVDDPHEPLFTLAVAADLLELDTQALRRLESAAELTSTRPSGNQRRYSRADLDVLSRAAELSRSGTAPAAFARILDLERQIAALAPEDGPPDPQSRNGPPPPAE
jgi:MerR family transcriptional regulator/heat shock protein HspR